MKVEWKEDPDETDFPLIDRCVICDELCAWQPRFEIAARPADHANMLSIRRPLGFVSEYRVVKFCAECIPNSLAKLRYLVRKHYPAYALLHPTKFGRRAE